MKVADLIAVLMDYPGDAEIVPSYEGEFYGLTVADFTRDLGDSELGEIKL